MSSTTVPFTEVKKEITPRGDGNIAFSRAFTFVIFVKKEITPRGDGNIKMFSVNVTLHRHNFYKKEDLYESLICK